MNHFFQFVDLLVLWQCPLEIGQDLCRRWSIGGQALSPLFPLLCKLLWKQVLFTKMGSSMQQANNYTLERGIDYLFQSCPSLGAWWHSSTPAIKVFSIYTF